MQPAGVGGLGRYVLVAPDKFKGTFTAAQVAGAIADGLRSVGQSAVCCPLADGGEGTIDALVAALKLELRTVSVGGPLGEPTSGRFAAGAGDTAVVESSSASGLMLVDPARRDPIRASTRGTGELILAAAAAGAKSIWVAVGGSATTDGGVGAIAAIVDGGGLDTAKLTVLCDVTTPFEDAAEVFGPQKGASADQVTELTARLRAQASALPRDPTGVPMTGAAGGLAGGLWAAFGADLTRGSSFVLDAVGFDALLGDASAVITGEGRIDDQTAQGKLVAEVCARASVAGVACHAVVGRDELDAATREALGLSSVTEASTHQQLVLAGASLGRLYAALEA